MPRVDIYTRSGCGFCTRALALLRSKGIDFTEIDITGDRRALGAMIGRAGGRMTVPQIFVGEVHVGGCDDLYDLEARGGLDALLGLEGTKGRT